MPKSLRTGILRKQVVDKKAKKKIEVLRKRTQTIQQRIAGAKEQTDEPDEIERLQQELADVKAEIERLKQS